MKRVYVIRKSDGAQVYDYDGEALPLDLFPSDEFDHIEIEVADPAATPVERPRQVWTKPVFLRRMNREERIATRAKVPTDPNVEDFMALLEQADEIANDDPDLIDGLNYLTYLGVLAAGRIDEILYG